MPFWSIAFVLACQSHADLPTLDALEAEKKSLTPKGGFLADVGPVRKVNEGVLTLVTNDQLKSGKDFKRASDLYTVLNWDFEDAREKYELTLSALALGDPDAVNSLPVDWDTLQVACGRQQRLGSLRVLVKFSGQKFRLDLAPKCVIQTITKPGEAVRRATGLADRAVLQQTVDADQKDRDRDWSKMNVEELTLITKRDRLRMALTKSLLKSPGARTAQDFFNAGQVLQHGEVSRDFALAHELCLCSILLGDKKDSRWLAAASYDRMLRNSGQRQRFATQYDAEGLQKLDSTGLNDTMRKALHCPALEDARKRVFK